MNKEENKKAFDALNTDDINEKMSEAGMALMVGEMDSGESFFGHVKSKFTHDEVAYIASVYIAKKTSEILEGNPMVGALVKMAKRELKKEDIMKTVEDIINPKEEEK